MKVCRNMFQRLILFNVNKYIIIFRIFRIFDELIKNIEVMVVYLLMKKFVKIQGKELNGIKIFLNEIFKLNFMYIYMRVGISFGREY